MLCGGWSFRDTIKTKVPGKDENQTFFYNFCRGSRAHGSTDNSAGFRCSAGVTGVCEVTDDTVGKGLAYPCGTVDNVAAYVTTLSPLSSTFGFVSVTSRGHGWWYPAHPIRGLRPKHAIGVVSSR